MRNLLSIIVLCGLFIPGVSAQKTKLGILAGPDMTTNNSSSRTVTNASNPSRDHNNTINKSFSFFGGMVASVPVSMNIIFRPQLQYIAKGWVTHHDFMDPSVSDYDTKLASHWIELPLNFVYNVPSKNGRFFFGLGPYASYALSATIHDDRESGDRKIEFKKGDATDTIPTANRFDIGANFIAAYEFRNGFFLSLNYSHGFVDFRNDTDDNVQPENKNIVIGLGIGYMFK